MNLGENQIEVLKRAAKKKGIVDMREAKRVYSKKQGAKKGVKGLVEKGILERVNYGMFKIVRLPKKLKEQFKRELK